MNPPSMLVFSIEHQHPFPLRISLTEELLGNKGDSELMVEQLGVIAISFTRKREFIIDLFHRPKLNTFEHG